MPAGGDGGEKANVLKERMRVFVDEIKKSETKGSCDVAIKTINLLIRIISQSKCSSAEALLDDIREESICLQAADPSENIIGNIIRRVLKIVREEHKDMLSDKGEVTQMQKLSLEDIDESDYSKQSPNLKSRVIEATNELKTEIEGCVENIAAFSPNYVNQNDVILTIGKSKTVESFLKHAYNKGVKFQVYVSEAAPFYHGQEMAKNLAQAKINTTLITECQIGPIMPKVNKVIIGTHSIMANGGLKAVTGTNILAVMAKEHNKPVIVCSSLYKLSPLFHSTPQHASFNKFSNPSELLDFEDAELMSKVEVIAPIFDYVPPDLVSMVVTNNGAQSVTYVYRLVKDFYHADDVNL